MSTEPNVNQALARDGNPHGRIVVGLDGSPESLAALRWAALVAERTCALLDVVAVWDGRGIHGWKTGPDGIDMRDVELVAHQVVAEAVDEVFGPKRPRGLGTYVLAGKPSETLVEHAAGGQLLVVGNRGRGTGLGSVSRWCTVHATCPVLVVHEADKVPIG